MLTRRRFIAGVAAGGAVSCSRAPWVRTTRPELTHGVQAGDVQAGRALVWARSSEPALMQVEWATTSDFGHARRVVGPRVGAASDHTGLVALADLPAGQTIHYRVRFTREGERGSSDWTNGRFRTPGAERIRFAWSGDTCGQGFGINPSWGGLKCYAGVRKVEPDFFLHSGDMIYADGPIPPELELAGGKIWKNLSNPRVARVAQELDDFRARFAYNLQDTNVRALAAEVPILAQWDDHETHNNWWPGQQLEDGRYQQRAASQLAAFARRAMFEWTPIGGGSAPRAAGIQRVISYGPLLDVVVVDLRSFRTPNDDNRGPLRAMMGQTQASWLVETLARSQAKWKIVACDQPLGLVIPDGPKGERNEGYGNGEGPPLGRELELSAVLSGIAARGVKNVIWLTADVHYAAAHHYDPARATLGESGAPFRPFWEFVAGPLHAISGDPKPLDPTFGPELRFQWAPPAGSGGLAPWDGLQNFGSVEIDGARDGVAVRIHDLDGGEKYKVELPYEG
ncbi:MAG TPA: alkaline phosphatase D family protein [Polyangiaceae bacterium]|nr:alkaline phosphatase D family protein [Polyangiaceae bacterium]